MFGNCAKVQPPLSPELQNALRKKKMPELNTDTKSVEQKLSVVSAEKGAIGRPSSLQALKLSGVKYTKYFVKN